MWNLFHILEEDHDGFMFSTCWTRIKINASKTLIQHWLLTQASTSNNGWPVLLMTLTDCSLVCAALQKKSKVFRVSSFNQHFHHQMLLLCCHKWFINGKKAVYHLLKSIFRASAFRLPLVLQSPLITFTRLNIWTQVSVRWAAECEWFVPLCSAGHERPVEGAGGLRWPLPSPGCGSL